MKTPQIEPAESEAREMVCEQCGWVAAPAEAGLCPECVSEAEEIAD